MVSRVRAVTGYLRTNLLLFLVCLALSRFGLGPLGMALFPFSVAACFLDRRPVQGLGVILWAAIVAWICLRSDDAVLRFAVVAGLGVPLGLSIAWGFSYGQAAALVAVCAYALIVGDILSSWDSWRRDLAASYAVLGVELTRQVEDSSPEMGDAMRQTVAWLQEHGSDLALGMIFWPVLAGVCGAVSLMSHRARRTFALPGVRGGFSSLRPPDWFVWFVIVLCALWYAEHRWPNPALRACVWNASLAVAGVYWMNGLSIVAFTIRMLRPNLLILFLIVFLLLNGQMHPMLAFVGLFDTWVNFRDRVRRLALLRMRLNRARDDE